MVEHDVNFRGGLGAEPLPLLERDGAARRDGRHGILDALTGPQLRRLAPDRRRGEEDMRAAVAVLADVVDRAQPEGAVRAFASFDAAADVLRLPVHATPPSAGSSAGQSTFASASRCAFGMSTTGSPYASS